MIADLIVGDERVDVRARKAKRPRLEAALPFVLRSSASAVIPSRLCEPRLSPRSCGGTDVAAFARADSFDVGATLEVGEGRVIAWGDEWITYDSRLDAAIWTNFLRWVGSSE